MKRNEGKYPEVRELPKGAMTVKEYAEKANLSVSGVYMQYLRGNGSFKIVLFKGINFIVP